MLKDQGGAGLVDLEEKDSAVKMSWAFKIQKSDRLKNLAYQILSNPIGDTIWEIQLVTKDLPLCFDPDSFWFSVLQKWAKSTFDRAMGRDSVLKQMIWFNSNIRIGGKPVFNLKLYEKGVVYISDLLNGKNDFLTFSEAQEKYGFTCPFTEYLGLLDAIPLDWKDWIKDPTQNIQSHGHETLLTKFQTAPRKVYVLYRYVKAKDDLLQYHVLRWQRKIPDIELGELVSHICKISKVTNFVKLQSFQYRFMLRAIITINVQLVKYKLRQSESCTFCNQQRESLLHLFYECYSIQPLWDWIGTMSRSVTWKDVATVRVNENPKAVVNILVLAVKHYIYVTHCTLQKPNLESCKIYCKNIEKIEVCIANKNHKQNYHNKKWSDVQW